MKKIIGLFLLVCSVNAYSVVLDIRGGQLHGATGVIVDGDSYDVSFIDGTCFDLYNGCDEASDFPFPVVDSTPAVVVTTSAYRAAQALLDQVFVDSTLGQFGTDPTTINGCTYLRSCAVYFPILARTLGGASYYDSISAYIGQTTQGIGLTYGTPLTGDYTFHTNTTFAVWTGSASTQPPPSGTIPEPTSLALLGLGLAGFGFSRKKKKI